MVTPEQYQSGRKRNKVVTVAKCKQTVRKTRPILFRISKAQLRSQTNRQSIIGGEGRISD